MLFRSAAYSLFLLLLLSVRSVFALSTDPRLLQLVPPQSRLVAGMSSSAAQGKTGSFLLIATENKIDLSDFFALTGGDASRRLNGLVFVSAAGRVIDKNEHSLLASGRFNRESIFRFAAAGARRESYRGVPVLVVPPFERERETFHEMRWLAVPEENIAIFGSVGSVRRELDRWVERSAPDQMLVDRLQRLKGQDDSWCVLLTRDREGIAEKVLGKLDPKLGKVAHEGELVAYGIKFGRKVEVVAAADPFPGKGWNVTGRAPGGEGSGAMHMFSFVPEESVSGRAAVKVSRRRYEEWIDEFDGAKSLFARAAVR
jgi:hypothetical protein